MLDERLSSEEYGIGFKKGNTELRDTVQTTLLGMLYDGTFERIAKKWELTDSMCLSMDDKIYVDGGKVPEPDTSKLTKKSEDTQADDAATESAGTVKKQGIGQIVKQLGQGMLATLGIFFFTLLFSMPLGLLAMDC